MHHIVNNLWLGSQKDADELVRRNPEGITAILNVRGPDAYKPPGRDQSAEHAGKKYKWIPAPDTGRISPEHLREAVAWLQEQTENGERILVHCKHGISRSAGFLAAFMVKRGLAATVEEATAIISAHTAVQPAVEVAPAAEHVILTSPVTGLPNWRAFDEDRVSAFVAAANVELMKTFNQYFGRIAGDVLLQKLAKILTGLGLEVYHSQGDEFLCKGDSREELEAKLSRGREIFQRAAEMYADGRLQMVEGTDFLFGIGGSVEEAKATLKAEMGKARDRSPEWLRQIIGAGGQGW
jgi:GGDEF domain-containing protein